MLYIALVFLINFRIVVLSCWCVNFVGLEKSWFKGVLSVTHHKKMFLLSFKTLVVEKLGSKQARQLLCASFKMLVVEKLVMGRMDVPSL